MLGGNRRGDPRVKGVLDRLGFRYEVDNDGDFKVQVLLPGGRSQVGFINSGTQLFCGIEIREIWSLAFIAPGLPNERLANILLKDNSEVKLGAWRVKELRDGRSLVIFAAHISADVDEETLNAVLEVVLRKADQLEANLTGEDRY